MRAVKGRRKGMWVRRDRQVADRSRLVHMLAKRGQPLPAVELHRASPQALLDLHCRHSF